MNDGLVIAVTGGRDYANSRAVFGALDRVNSTRGISLLIHGDATGADSHAKRWAEVTGTPAREFRADWEAHGRAAGPMRNAEMVAVGLDGLVAFPGGRGTADMIRQCNAAGVNIWEVR